MRDWLGLLACSCMLLVSLTYSQWSVAEGLRRVNSRYYPYLPQRRDYSVELGSMWETNNLYWLGAAVGFHAGRCFFIKSTRCQSYWDVIAGAAGRDGQTIGKLMGGHRWQFFSPNRVISPSFRTLIGYSNIRDNARDLWTASVAMDVGITASVHKEVNLRTTYRVGFANDRVWSQLMVALELRAEEWVTRVGRHIKKVSKKTWKWLKDDGDTESKEQKKTQGAPAPP